MGIRMVSRTSAALDRFAFETRRVDKPWGYELIWALTEDYCGKMLFVRAGESLSLQFHHDKDESWYVHRGRAELELGAPAKRRSDGGDVGRGGVPFRAGHRPSRERARGHAILEVSTPQLDDIVRLEDCYGRGGHLGRLSANRDTNVVKFARWTG